MCRRPGDWRITNNTGASMTGTAFMHGYFTATGVTLTSSADIR